MVSEKLGTNLLCLRHLLSKSLATKGKYPLFVKGYHGNITNHLTIRRDKCATEEASAPT